MARLDRRQLIQAAGVGGLAATSGRGPPAYARGTTLHWLRLGDFVPASDTLLRRELLPARNRQVCAIEPSGNEIHQGHRRSYDPTTQQRRDVLKRSNTKHPIRRSRHPHRPTG
jgi:FAD/FMN-containing dehydrogenase